MSRTWKDVSDYENLYEVSNDKIIRNKETLYELKKYQRNGRGSLYVALTKNGKTSSVRVETIYHLAFRETTSNLKNETWKDIEGYCGVYQISNCGRVKSLDRYIEQRRGGGSIYNRFIKGRILSLGRTNGNGYHIVQLSNGYNDQPKNNEYIHTLVAKHFIPNPQNKPTVNHKDGNKSNNHVDNLEWATQQEQMIHAYNNNLNKVVEHTKGKQLKGSQVPWAKLNEEQAMEIYKLSNSGKYTGRQIAEKYGVDRKTVEGIKYRKTWKHIHEAS